MSELGNKRVFANNLQRLMDERNIDRRELCAAINTPYTTVCDWLNAKTYPRIDKIEQMSKYFSVKKSALTEMNADTSVELTEKQLRRQSKKYDDVTTSLLYFEKNMA